jgi:UDP-glucose-4-epimerase GalE
VKWGPLVEGDTGDISALRRCLDEYKPLSVMHFAAFAYVEESVRNPGLYYRNNVANTLVLLDAMVEKGVNKLVFSSSCASYGIPAKVPIEEDAPQNPINPYGWGKLMVEKILEDYDRAHGLKSISLRYFNAAGADPDGEIGERHEPETHLIPVAIEAAMGKRPHVEIFGNDYPTPDGTCIRDFVHVMDLAQAHFLAMERLLNGAKSDRFNLGNGKGYSVMQVVTAMESIAKRAVKIKNMPRRTGDPPVLIANSDKIQRELGWKRLFPDLISIGDSAISWHRGQSGNPPPERGLSGNLSTFRT